MKFYYGSESLLLKPVFGVGNPTNDYGVGFYLTKDKEAARLWASKSSHTGYLMEYDVDINGLKVLYLNTLTEKDVLSWIAILVEHRFSKELRATYKKRIDWLKERYPIDTSEYDVIVGYRADDSYFDYSIGFMADDLSLESLEEAMHLGKLGMQTVLISERAFSRIRYINHEEVKPSDEYRLFRAKARAEYRKLRVADSEDNTFLRDLIRRESKR